MASIFLFFKEEDEEQGKQKEKEKFKALKSELGTIKSIKLFRF